MTPSMFFSLTDEDKAFMIAHDRAISEMQSYETYLDNKEIAKKK